MQIHELPSGTPTDSDLLPFDTGDANYKTPFSGFDVGENTATFTSGDEATPSQFKTVSLIETGPIKTILNRLSMVASNVKFIYSLVQSLLNKTTIINYNAAAGEFNISHDSSHRLILNKGVNGGYELFRLDAGDTTMIANDTTGQFDLHLDTGVTHRIYLCDGSNNSYDEMMVVRCGNTYIERPSSADRLNLVSPGGIWMNGNRWGLVPTTYTYTTSAAGNITYEFDKKSIVLAAFTTSADMYVSAYPTSGTGTGGAKKWWFHVQDATSATGAAVTGTSVTLVIFSVPLE